jgi:serine/threonine protein kinase
MGGAKQDEKSVFNAARRIESAEARRRYLARACEDDPELRTRVEALLRIYHEGDSFLRTPGLGVGNLLSDAEPETDHARGTVIGPYKLADRLGEGGMGVVYLAEQVNPVRRQVALKIVRPGMDTEQIVARLGAEREALALMDHPHIARVLDAGVTPPGRPYFVMELVRGVPITRYCDEVRLPLADRLKLFAQVCRGVQHAHQKGIIHRDIKPSNVLVTVVDGKPIPKIIDFGLAKVIGRKSADDTLLTQVGVVVGTPDYMSPEQADPGCPDIDTRSDVYALGVLLYELLTGVTPLSRGGEAGRLADILFRIREEQPARPSARLRDSPDLAVVAAARAAEPSRLVRLVRGDLDWVVMRCLDKDRSRRYDSADGLARDVERYLRHEPVEASPPSIGYRLKKFARRHRAALATAAGFLLLLVGGTVVSAWQAVRATTAERAALEDRDRAEAARGQARRALNKLTDEAVERLLARQGRVTEEDREFLRQVLSLHEEFAGTVADTPETRAAVAAARFRVGVIRYRLGEFREAEAAYRGAIDLRRALADEFPGQPGYRLDLALSHVRLGALLRETGQTRPAEEAFTTAVGLSRKLADEFPGQPDYLRDVAVAHNHLGRRPPPSSLAVGPASAARERTGQEL